MNCAKIAYNISHQMPVICKNCKYFKLSIREPYVTDIKTQIEYGTCTKHGKVNLVSGEITHDYAAIVREYTCKGADYEDINTLEYATK